MVGHLPLEEVILVRVQVWQPARALLEMHRTLNIISVSL